MTNGEQPGRSRHARWWGAGVLLVLGVLGVWGYVRYFIDAPVTYADDDEHFKYGSVGADDAEGVPYEIWRVLPDLFPHHLPDEQAYRALPRGPDRYLEGYRQFGFVFEPGRDTPIGMSKRRVAVTRIGLNCAVCHVSTLRVTEGCDPAKLYDSPSYATGGAGGGANAERVVILGMPAATLDLQAYLGFLFACAGDARFTPGNVLAHIEARTKLNPIDRLIYRAAVPRVRTVLLERRQALAYFDDVPRLGPGRVDTFNPYKLIQFRFPYDDSIGTADFPSIWNQRPRVGMHLHWDGNNTSVFERNVTAALGTSARPSTLDVDRLLRIASWCGAPDPREPVPAMASAADRAAPFPQAGELPIPGYPFATDADAVAAGKELYGTHCASCHDWLGEHVGQVTAIDAVGTDRKRLDSFTAALAVNFSAIGIEQWWRFTSYRKTNGYANVPLDGIWIRAPYLHNGSVPSLLDLLHPVCSDAELIAFGLDPAGPNDDLTETQVAEIIDAARALGRRPPLFYRGDDVYDPGVGGFRCDRASSDDGRRLFLYDTSRPGNTNGGHDYGTDLSPEQKHALVAYLLTIGGNGP